MHLGYTTGPIRRLKASGPSTLRKTDEVRAKMTDVDASTAAKVIGLRLAGPIYALTSWSSVFAICDSQRRGGRLVSVDAIGVESRRGVRNSARKKHAAEHCNSRAESIKVDSINHVLVQPAQ